MNTNLSRQNEELRNSLDETKKNLDAALEKLERQDEHYPSYAVLEVSFDRQQAYIESLKADNAELRADIYKIKTQSNSHDLISKTANDFYGMLFDHVMSVDYEKVRDILEKMYPVPTERIQAFHEISSWGLKESKAFVEGR